MDKSCVIRTDNCAICDEDLDSSKRDIFNETTWYSNSRICEILSQFMGENFPISQMIPGVQSGIEYICEACFIRINCYDEAVSTVERIQGELADLYRTTLEKYTEAEVGEVLFSEEVNVGEGSASERETLISYEFEIPGVKEEEMSVELVTQNSEESETEQEARYIIVQSNQEGFVEPVEECDQLVIHQTDFIAEIFTYQCDVCGQAFSTEKSLNMHIKKHSTSSQLKRHACDECGQTFTTEKSLNMHLKKHSTSSHLKTHACDECDQVFSTEKSLNTHLKKHSISSHVKTHSTNSHSCDICHKTFKYAKSLKLHKDVHLSGEQGAKYKCDQCNKTFTQRGGLKKHLLIHTGEKPYQCDACGKRFTHSTSFHMHKLAHEGVREKVCPECGLKLYSTSHLNRHMRSHSGLKPFECPTCHVRFAQRYNMMAHLKTHDGIARRRVYKCELCHEKFDKNALYKEHKTTCSMLPIDANSEINS